MKKTEKKKPSKVQVVKEAYSEQIITLVQKASILLERAPKTLEVRGATKKLRIALNALIAAGKFAEVKE